MRIFLCLLAIGLCFLAGLFAVAQPAAAQGASPLLQPIDVAVVLDDSASMGTCWPWKNNETQHQTSNCIAQHYRHEPSDRDNKRYSAAKLMVHLADPEDRIAVYDFDSKVAPVGGAGLQTVGDSAHRRAMSDALQAPTDYSTRGETRIDLGLQQATDTLLARQGDEAKRPAYIVFLTDGTPFPNEQAQTAAVTATMQRLRAAGITVFPIMLCDDGACQDDAILRLMGAPRLAQNGEELVSIFSQIFATMKPTLHIITTRNSNHDVEFNTRVPQGVTSIKVVSVAGAFQALKVNNADQTVQTVLSDRNIVVNEMKASAFAQGSWTASAGSGGFVVVHANNYPELIFPPPSVPGSTTAPRYVPAGKQALLVGSIVGTAGNEDRLYLNSSTPLKPLTPDLRWIFLPGPAPNFTLQAGADVAPLQIIRPFSLVPVGDDKLPLAEADTPTCLANQPCTLSAHFRPGPEVGDLSGMVYVAEKTQEGDEQPLFVQALTCSDRRCSDSSFDKAQDGHTYIVRFLLQARANGMFFGDWAEAPIAMSPAIYVGGLNDPLNLASQPKDGWDVTVTARTSEDLGRLQATLVLTQTDSNQPATNLQVLFGAALNNTAQQTTKLQILGLDQLHAGRYSGELRFSTEKPAAGAPVKLIPSSIEVVYDVSKVKIRLLRTTLNFGQLVADPPPGTSIDKQSTLPLQFDGRTTELRVKMGESDCPELMLGNDPLRQAADGSYELPLHLQSNASIKPKTCTGSFSLEADPQQDFDITPGATLSWSLTIRPIEVDVLDTIADFGAELYQTTPNFRVDRRIPVRLSFPSGEFNITPVISTSNCPQLSLTGGPIQPGSDGNYTTELRLQSDGPIQPTTCRGTFTFQTPSDDYYVVRAASQLSWQLVIPQIEWSIRGVAGGNNNGDIIFGNLRSATERTTALLNVYYTGVPSFTLQLVDLRVSDQNGHALKLGQDVEWLSEPVSAQETANHIYPVAVTLRALRDIPHDMWGSNYSGQVTLNIDGLPTWQQVVVPFSFHSPNWVERYVGPWFVFPFPAIGTLLGMLLCLAVLLLLMMLKASRSSTVEPVPVAAGGGSAEPSAYPALPGTLAPGLPGLPGSGGLSGLTVPPLPGSGGTAGPPGVVLPPAGPTSSVVGYIPAPGLSVAGPAIPPPPVGGAPASSPLLPPPQLADPAVGAAVPPPPPGFVPGAGVVPPTSMGISSGAVVSPILPPGSSGSQPPPPPPLP